MKKLTLGKLGEGYTKCCANFMAHWKLISRMGSGVPEFRKQRQEDLCEFKANLVYTRGDLGQDSSDDNLSGTHGPPLTSDASFWSDYQDEVSEIKPQALQILGKYFATELAFWLQREEKDALEWHRAIKPAIEIEGNILCQLQCLGD
ncbi:hypothetical protein STEG23_007937 [Scotinomys teguina]